MTYRIFLFLTAFVALPALHAQTLTIDNFEADAPGAAPSKWVFYTSRGESQSLDRHFNEREQFLVVREGRNRFLRLYTRGEAQRITFLTDGSGFVWRLDEYGRLRWRWRANKLPQGASENRRNDVAGAVYVTFGTDRIGRPRSIKYTYSSSLPVGTILKQGALRVVVVSSTATGRWETIERDVALDYRAVFGGQAPDPKSITLWSDSDDTRSEAEVDVDDLVLLPPKR